VPVPMSLERDGPGSGRPKRQTALLTQDIGSAEISWVQCQPMLLIWSLWPRFYSGRIKPCVSQFWHSSPLFSLV
jgi:hypothetical protein